MIDSELNRRPSILMIDDMPDELRALGGLVRDQADVEVRHPRDVTKHELLGADLVLIDYLIEDWAERENSDSITLQPMNGLALASVLRAHLNSHEAGKSHPSPTAIALLSGQLNQISGGLSSEIRAHAIARVNNLEWAFEKAAQGSSPGSLTAQFVSLADAVRGLPGNWPSDPDHVKEIVQEFLGLSGELFWSSRAWADIEDCHPPIHELFDATHGLALLRWMLHRILPYPCFLFDSFYLAARLGIEYSDFDLGIENPEFHGVFETARYSGSISEFLGPRWWRAGVESLLWDLTDGRSFDLQVVLDCLEEKSMLRFDRSEIRNPIVCVGSDYAPLDAFCSAEESVRIQPDDWPSFAEQAWTTIGLALSHPILRSLVIHEDKDRLASKSNELRSHELAT